jgi:hypothetical protein
MRELINIVRVHASIYYPFAIMSELYARDLSDVCEYINLNASSYYQFASTCEHVITICEHVIIVCEGFFCIC